MLSRDMQQICVDGAVFEDFPGRYRFSLAHEVGHRQLHADIYAQLQFSEIADWKNLICNEVGEKDYGKLEFQAYAFAGLILVPPHAARRMSSMRPSPLAESRGIDGAKLILMWHVTPSRAIFPNSLLCHEK